MSLCCKIKQLILPPAIALFFSHLAIAQADYYFGDTKELPTFAVGQVDTDHAVIAVNAFGDVIVVNQATISGNQKLVEANVLSPNGNPATSGFTLFPLILLGDPTLDVLGVAADTCKKPDVEALGDNSFIVVWSRHDMHVSAPVNSQIEACRVTTRDANGVLYPAPIVTSLNPGEGFVIDDTANSGDAGFMPDIAAIGNSAPDKAYIVYAHETVNSVRALSTFREYDIRCVAINWSNQSNPNNFISTPATLTRNIPFDRDNTSSFGGGLILPDAVIDDYGKLVVAHEEFVIQPHLQHTGQEQGSIRVMRYEPDTAALPFDKLNDIEFLGHNSYMQQRRPMISTSNADGNNHMLLAWIENDIVYNAPRRALFREIDIDSANSETLTSISWDESFGVQDHLPTTAMSGTTHLIASTREFPASKHLILNYKKNPAPIVMTNLSTTIVYPHRSAYNLLDYANETFLFAAFEGGATQASLKYRIYLNITRLQ